MKPIITSYVIPTNPTVQSNLELKKTSNLLKHHPYLILSTTAAPLQDGVGTAY